MPQENVVSSSDAADGYLDVDKQIKIKVKLISSTLRRVDDMVCKSSVCWLPLPILFLVFQCILLQ